MAVIRGLILISVAIGSLMAMDYILAKRANELLAQVETRKNNEKEIIFTDQPADICNAITGGIWLKPIMVFTSKITHPQGCTVTVREGRCSRGLKHKITFKCVNQR